MSIVTVTDFKAYAKKLDGDTAGEALYQIYIDAAEAEVERFLGFHPASAERAETLFGDGLPRLSLGSRPVTAIASISVDGVAKSPNDYFIRDEIITHKANEQFPAGSVIDVAYTAGWSTIPPAIVVSILQIATLLCMEAGENIGVSSTSFDGGNTRSFIQYTNFGKYLAKIEDFRVRRLPRLAP